MTDQVEVTEDEQAAPAPKRQRVKSANVGTKTKAEPPAQDDDDVLNLTSLVPSRKLVKLPTKSHPEGEAFELRLLDDFGIVDQQKLLTWSKRFEELWNKDEDLTEDEGTQMKHLLDVMFDKVLDAPEEDKGDMPDHIRSRVVTAFTLVPLLARQEAEIKAQAAEKERLALSGSPSTSES